MGERDRHHFEDTPRGELYSLHKEARQPADTIGSLMQQQSVDAWNEISNLSKNQQAQINGRKSQNDGTITFDMIFSDSDSVTHCRGFSGPDLSAIKCVTKDLAEKPERNEKPFPDKNDKSLHNNHAEPDPLRPLKEKISEKPSLPTPEKPIDDFPTIRPLTDLEQFRRNRIVDPIQLQLEKP